MSEMQDKQPITRFSTVMGEVEEVSVDGGKTWYVKKQYERLEKKFKAEKRKALELVLEKLDEQYKDYMKAENLDGAWAIISVQAIVKGEMG